MNEARMYADGFETMFAKQEDFMAFLKQIGRVSSWDRRRSKDLRLIAFEADSKIAGELQEQYDRNGQDPGIFEDTLQNTGMLLKVKRQYYPVRSCAIQSILNRAGISGPALRKVDKNVYARILNDCLKVAKGDALLRFSAGKVSAVLGGDGHDYAVLDMEQIFAMSVEYLQKTFPGCSYLGGFYDHTRASAIWEIGGEEKLLSVYKAELAAYGLNPTDMELKPVIRVTTSNTGDSGVNIYPMLMFGAGKKSIALGDPLRLEHKNGATLQKFEEQLKLTYGKYQLAVGKLSRLLMIPIYHPINCMVGVMKRLDVPKRYAMEAADMFKSQYGEDPCTAHELYYGISEVIFMLETEGESGSRITKMEEKIARALGINWKDYDLAQEVKW